jgi:hypothetical protein
MRFLLTSVLFVAGCQESTPRPTLSDNVAASFTDCSDAEIKLLATKHNFMPAFKPCGNNRFESFSWSPDGTSLYFQLVNDPYIMDAASPTKAVSSVPIRKPIGTAHWLNSSRFVVPIGPSKTEPGHRLAVVQLGDAPTVNYQPLRDIKDVRSIVTGPSSLEILMLVERQDGTTEAQTLHLGDGTTQRVLAWYPHPIDSLTYAADRDILVIGSGNTVRVVHQDRQEIMGAFAPAKRGTLHPSGEWLALEHKGEPISVFYQQTWESLSPRELEREKRRAADYASKLPKHLPTEVEPPTLSFAHLPTGKRWRLSSVHGHNFSWYTPTPNYGSFLFWGFEGKQHKRNVLLGSFADRLKHMKEGRDFHGVHLMEQATTSRLDLLEDSEPEAGL